MRGLLRVYVGAAAAGAEAVQNELLLGKDKKPEDCLDEDGYVSYVLPRLGVLTVTW